MYSKQLEQLCKPDYRLFFQQHDLVLSLPFGVNWMGTPNPHYKGLSIKQKIPL